jgi:hypothetical protein
MDTLLVISGMGFSPYAARGLTQTLQPIEQAKQLRRTASGKLVDISVEQFRKYRSTISCTDQRVPAIDGIWPGMVVTVSCVAELSYPVGGTPSRPAVSGSLREEAGYVFYRPVLEMRVVDIGPSTDEFAAEVAWTLELEEE